jgi:hypothetical protein
MYADTKVKTFWQPKGQPYWCEHEDTLGKFREYGVDWLPMVESGATYLVIDRSGSANPGTMIVIVHPI